MNKLLYFCITLFLTLAGLTSAHAQVIYVNNFNAGSPAWVGDADNADLTTRLTTGKFYLTHKKKYVVGNLSAFADYTQQRL